MVTYLVTRMVCDHKFTKFGPALNDFLYDNTKLEVTIRFKDVTLVFQCFPKTQVNNQTVNENVNYLSNDNNIKVAMLIPKILVFPSQR